MVETDLDVTMNVHRWPRIIAVVAAVYFVFQAGVAAVAPGAASWVLEKIPVLVPLLAP